MTDQHYEARPGFTARAADSAGDAARAGRDIAQSFAEIVDRVSDVVEGMRAPGQPLDRVAQLTRKAPLAALATAFLLGIVITRRR